MCLLNVYYRKFSNKEPFVYASEIIIYFLFCDIRSFFDMILIICIRIHIIYSLY